MIEKFEPAIPFINGFEKMMLEKVDGEWVRLETVLDWLKEQRNDTPITGLELANGLALECGMGSDYFKE